MQIARLDTARILTFYYPSGLLPTPRVVVSDGATTLATISLSSSAFLANLLIASTALTVTSVGTFTLTLQESDGLGGFTTVLTDVLRVGLDPVSPIALSTVGTQVFRLDDAIVGNTTSTVTLQVVKQDDTLHESVITAAYDASEGVYKATTTTAVSAEGTYSLIWFDDGAVTQVDTLVAFVPRGFETVQVQVVDTSGGSTVPYTATQVLFSKADGTAYASATTNSSGLVSVQLPPAAWVVSLLKNNTTFSTNNTPLTVTNMAIAAEGVNNNFTVNVESFAAVFTSATAPASTCLLSASLFDFEGLPLIGNDVIVELHQGPSNFSGSGVFGQSKVFKTDTNGYVEFNILQGTVVTISVVGHSFRRKVTVPALATANFITLAAASADLFDIVEVSIPDAPRRSI